MISLVVGWITGAHKCWRPACAWISSIGLVSDSWLSFMIGKILLIPTAANENAISAFWLITLRVWNDGIAVLCVISSGWNTLLIMGTSSVMLACYLFDALSAQVFLASSLFAYLVSLALTDCVTLSTGEKICLFITLFLWNCLISDFSFSFFLATL